MNISRLAVGYIQSRYQFHMQRSTDLLSRSQINHYGEHLDLLLQSTSVDEIKESLILL